ncbi:ribbon-helix-helix protein, CopG family, partial [Streptococcus pneumoniae]
MVNWKEERKTSRFGLAVTDEMYEQVKALAAEHEASIGEVVRAAVSLFLSSESIKYRQESIKNVQTGRKRKSK